MRLFKGHEKGFSLVELLVAIPIIGLLGFAMVAVLIQLLHSDRISQRMVAVRQVQAAGDRVSIDGVQAQSVVFGADMISEDSEDPILTLHWSGDWVENSNYVVREVWVKYYLFEATDGLWELERREWLNADPSGDPTVENTVADSLDVNQMSLESLDGGITSFAFKVVAVVGTKTEERTYNVTPRPQG